MPKNKITDRFPFVKTVPPGFVTLREFSVMAGVTDAAVRKYVRAGKFSDRNIFSFQHKSGPAGLIINWNAEGTKYVDQLPKTHRPADYVPGQLYKPIPVDGDALEGVEITERNPVELAKEQRAAEVEQNKGEELDAPGLAAELDLTSTRMRNVQIKNKKEEYELRVLRNELLEMPALRGLMRQIAVEIRSAHNKLLNAVSPALAAENDPKKIKRILQTALKETLAPLGKTPGAE